MSGKHLQSRLMSRSTAAALLTVVGLSLEIGGPAAHAASWEPMPPSCTGSSSTRMMQATGRQGDAAGIGDGAHATTTALWRFVLDMMGLTTWRSARASASVELIKGTTF